MPSLWYLYNFCLFFHLLDVHLFVYQTFSLVRAAIGKAISSERSAHRHTSGFGCHDIANIIHLFCLGYDITNMTLMI